MTTRAPQAAALHEVTGPESKRLATGTPAAQESLTENATTRSAEGAP